MEFHTRSKSRVLADLVEKLQSLPQNHPDRPHLLRMIMDLGCEIEQSGLDAASGHAGGPEAA